MGIYLPTVKYTKADFWYGNGLPGICVTITEMTQSGKIHWIWKGKKGTFTAVGLKIGPMLYSSKQLYGNIPWQGSQSKFVFMRGVNW